MSQRLLDKYTNCAETTESGPPIESDLVAFGWMRGLKDCAYTLELRKKTGNILAISYSHIEKFEFDPSGHITLHAGGQKFHIKGRNLNREVRSHVQLFQGLTGHRVPWVQEAEQSAKLQIDENATIIDLIEW